MLAGLRWAGLAFVSVLFIILFLLLFPLKVVVKYKERTLQVDLHYLFLKFRIHPKKTEKKVNDLTEQARERSNRQWPELSRIKQVAMAAAETSSWILRRIRITDAEIVLVAYGRDPAQIGILTGQMWGLLGEGIAALECICKTELKRAEVIPDFDGNQGGQEMFCAVAQSPGWALLCAVGLFFINTLRYRKDV